MESGGLILGDMEPTETQPVQGESVPQLLEDEPTSEISEDTNVDAAEMSPEDAELLSMRFVEMTDEDLSVGLENSQAEDQDVDTEDSSTGSADQLEAQIVADMADLQHGTQECFICTDDVCHSKVLQLGCGEHWICHDCIADPFEHAINAESHYPSQCCGDPLRIEDFEHLLAISKPGLVAQYEAKVFEYSMDKRFRRYCGAEDCKTFLNPDSYDRDEANNLTTADCPKCNQTTCVFCTKIVAKAVSHECESVLNKFNKDYSAEARFKYCPFCGRPGLLDEGCNHVTCECGEEWCFICIRKWYGGEGHEECGQYNDPTYDSEGYDENGFHRDTGIDREGFNRDGFNVAGFDRDGNKVADFARLERDRLHAPPPRPAGFLDLDDENFEETAMVLFISEREAGIVHETDNFEHLLALRFPGFREGNRGQGAGRGRGRGGFGRGRGGGFGGHQVIQWADDQGHEDANDDEEGEDDRFDDPEQNIINAGEWGNNENPNDEDDEPTNDNDEVEDPNHDMPDMLPEVERRWVQDWNTDEGVRATDGEVDLTQNAGQAFEGFDIVQGAEDPGFASPFIGPATMAHYDPTQWALRPTTEQNDDLDTIGAGIPALQVDPSYDDLLNAAIAAENGPEADLNLPAAHEAIRDQEADIQTDPQAPTPGQINCQHDWNLAAAGNPCKACTITCEDYAMVCTICLVEACGECSQNFSANALLNWPGAGEERDELEELGQPGAWAENSIAPTAGQW